MSKNYIETAPPKEFKLEKNTLQSILNYSKSIEVKTTKKNRKLASELN